MGVRKEEENIKLFKCNTVFTEVAEWCFARNKLEAYTFMKEFWDCGAIMDKMYLKAYLKSNREKSKSDFIEAFFIEENLDSDFTHPYAGENDSPVTKKVWQWIEEAGSFPSYFCHEKWD